MNTPGNFVQIRHSPLLIKEISCKTPAGFPSPAQDLAVNRIDLNDILIQQPEDTYFMQDGPKLTNFPLDPCPQQMELS